MKSTTLLAAIALLGATACTPFMVGDRDAEPVHVISGYDHGMVPVSNLATARDRGCRIVDGVEMLVQLAMQIFEQWTGIKPEEKVFQRAVAEALGE